MGFGTVIIAYYSLALFFFAVIIVIDRRVLFASSRAGGLALVAHWFLIIALVANIWPITAYPYISAVLRENRERRKRANRQTAKKYS